MGECDRLKKHISDYLEGNLDKTTRKEFEHALAQNEDLNNLTTRVREIPVLLNKLPAHKCSDDFAVNLRKKIHSNNSQARLPVTPLKKYSFVFSFAVLAVIIIFSFNMLEDNSSEVKILPESTNIQNSNPRPPAVQTPSQPVSNSPVSNQEIDIKTVDEQKVAADSVGNVENGGNKKNFKYVDDKKK